MFEHDYLKAYQSFRFIPVVNALGIFVPTVVFAIVDCRGKVTAIGNLGFGGFCIWFILGILVALLVYWYTKVRISPIVLQADAALIKLQEQEEKTPETSIPQQTESISQKKPEHKKQPVQPTIIPSVPSAEACELCQSTESALTMSAIYTEEGMVYKKLCPECIRKTKKN